MYVDLVRDVKRERHASRSRSSSGPYFSSMANMAARLDAAGADGLVLFNRFYQPDFDLEALEVVPNLTLSNSHELLLRLHWIADPLRPRPGRPRPHRRRAHAPRTC